MSESRAKQQQEQADSPYRRVGILALCIIAALALIFAWTFVARAFGGNEAKLMEAVVNTLKQPRINGQFSLAQQAQTNTFSMKGSFVAQDLNKLSLTGELDGAYQGEQLKVPLKAYSDIKQGTTYVNISNAPQVAETIGASAPTLKPDLTSLAGKIDNKWVKIQQGKNTANSCTSDLFSKISTDSDAAKQLANIFSGNRFLVVDGVEKKSDTTQIYKVKYNEDAMTGFIKSLKASSFFKATKSCDSVYDPLGTEAAATAKASSSTQQAAQSQKSSITTKMTATNGRITDITVVSSLNNQVNTSRISLDFKSGQPLTAPTDNIIESSSIQQEMTSLGKIFQQQQLQQQQQSAQSSQALQ